jgi:hypothetical protein
MYLLTDILVGWRAVMGTMGLESADTIWTDATYPMLSILSSSSTYLSTTHFFRRVIFRICWSVALGKDRFCLIYSKISSACEWHQYDPHHTYWWISIPQVQGVVIHEIISTESQRDICSMGVLGVSWRTWKILCQNPLWQGKNCVPQ